MIDLCELGERPPLGEVPKRMHAYVVRQNRFGQPRDAWKREVIPTPTLGPDEVLVYVMAPAITNTTGGPRWARPPTATPEPRRPAGPKTFTPAAATARGSS